MKEIDDDIKNGIFQPVYLLYGEEEYLLRQYKNKLLKALVKPDDFMNLNTFDKDHADPDAIISTADTLPFFAEKRVVLLEDSGFLKHPSEKLNDYMSSLPETTCMIFCERELDKRGKLYRYIKKNGRVVEFGRQKEQVLVRWILSVLKKENKKIRQRTLELFLSQTGNDMDVIHNELEKLLAYCLDKEEITEEDVSAVCANQVEGKIFEMIDAISSGHQEKALQRYRDLLLLREPSMRILYLITRQIHILTRLKSMQRAGMDNRQIAAMLKIPPFAVRKNKEQAAGFTQEQLEKAFEQCLQTDEDIKSGKIRDQIAAELLIVKLSERKERTGERHRSSR